LLQDEENREFSRKAGPVSRLTALRDALCEWERNGKLPSPKSLGKRLKAVKDRVVEGLVLRAVTNRTGSQVWRVEPAHPAGLTATGPAFSRN
jgi:hypothetical protein